MTTLKWDFTRANDLYSLPFMELMFEAQTVHRQHFEQNEMELCTLLSIKTGACPEDCAYCPQSGHFETGLAKENLLKVETVLEEAKRAKANGATRFCMGAAWRHPPKKQFPKVLEMIAGVKKMGMEACVTLGTLDEQQAKALHEAGLDYYNHNLDTSPDYYQEIITTRTYQERLDTLQHVRAAGINVCCGGIIGMGETREDRIELLVQLANLPTPPESVPINRLVPAKGTPLAKVEVIDNIEFIRTIATARLMMPASMIRLSAGRDTMSEEMHALCYMAGANSIFYGERLLTSQNAETDQDLKLLEKLGMHAKSRCQSAEVA